MKRILLILSSFVLAVILISSCTEQHAVGLEKWETLQPGAHLKFEEPVPAVVGVNSISDLEFSGTIIAPAGRVASYELEMYADLAATVNVRTDTVLLGTWTSFPLELSYNADELGDFIGMPIDSISFGDSFYFLGTIIDEDGNEYYAGDPSLEAVTNAEGDTTDLIFDSGGSVNEKIYDPTNGYKNVYQFQFAIGCPEGSMDIAALLGTWDITDDPFGAGLAASFEMVEGPGENQVTCIDLFAHPEAYDVILTLDPVTNAITVDKQLAWNTATFGMELGEASVEGAGTMFQCASFMVLNLEHTVTLGSWGISPLTCVKQ
ncbi:hypothetical protein ACFLT1_05095 [Bacteroidota bacterium]